MYYRSHYDKRKLKRYVDAGFAYACYVAYYDEDKGRYVRIYKGKNYTDLKRISRRRIRQRTKRTGFYSKKHDDLWWNWD